MYSRVNTLFIVTIAVAVCLGSADKLPRPGQCGIELYHGPTGSNRTSLYCYPWAAILIFREIGNEADLLHCGGSLISDRYVLTAAHCIDDLNETYTLDRIRFGELDLLDDPDCGTFMDYKACKDPPVDIGIEKIIKHEAYNSATSMNDIALIKLNRSAPDTDSIFPVCLPFDEVARNQSTNGLNFTAVGWGNTKQKNETYEYNIRYKMEFPLTEVNQTYCKQAREKDEIFPSQMCAEAPEDVDSCQGDSGSGLVYRVDAFYHQYGIMNHGRDCARKGIPGIHTRVTSYLDWIAANME